MASPQQSYTDGQPDPEGQDGGQDQAQQATPAPAAGAKKKRAYAGQAYEFGAGANAALGGQQPGGTAYPGSPPQPAGYGYLPPQQGQQPSYGMPQQPQYGDPNFQSQPAQPSYGQPQYGAPQGGYEPPQATYPVPGQQVVQPPTQGFQQMSIGGGPAPGQAQQPAPQPQQQQTQMRLNPLQPVDISMQGQPFHVTDLDQPPPAIILPPNVSFMCSKANTTLIHWLVFGHTIASCKLSAQVCSINAQCDADDGEPTQEEQVALRAYHSTLRDPA